MALLRIFKSKLAAKKKKSSAKKTAKPTKRAKPAKRTKRSKPVKPAKPVKRTKRSQPAKPAKPTGAITHYFGKISVGIIKLKAPLVIGDRIHIKGAHDDFKQTIKSMQIDHKDVIKAKRGDEIGIKVTSRVHENDRVYKL